VARVFADRSEAGRSLGRYLQEMEGLNDPVVLALPRGGVPVGVEIARALGVPLDVMVVRKLGLPGQPELAMGAVASGGIRVLNQELLRETGVPAEVLEKVATEETRELERREEAYRGGRLPTELQGRDVILVDDGIATGSSLLAAVAAARARGASRVMVAVPVAPRDVVRTLARQVDEMICLHTPEPFLAVSLWYRSFPQVQDSEVRALLDRG
jgi:putative phosphoribosyl transferase